MKSRGEREWGKTCSKNNILNEKFNYNYQTQSYLNEKSCDYKYGNFSQSYIAAFLHMGSNGQHLINRAVFFPVLLTNTLKWHTFNMLILSYKCFHFVLYV